MRFNVGRAFKGLGWWNNGNTVVESVISSRKGDRSLPAPSKDRLSLPFIRLHLNNKQKNR